MKKTTFSLARAGARAYAYARANARARAHPRAPASAPARVRARAPVFWPVSERARKTQRLPMPHECSATPLKMISDFQTESLPLSFWPGPTHQNRSGGERKLPGGARESRAPPEGRRRSPAQFSCVNPAVLNSPAISWAGTHASIPRPSWFPRSCPCPCGREEPSTRSSA